MEEIVRERVSALAASAPTELDLTSAEQLDAVRHIAEELIEVAASTQELRAVDDVVGPAPISGPGFGNDRTPTPI